MSKPAMNVLVRWCGRHETIQANIFEVGGANVIERLSAFSGSEEDYKNATFSVIDRPTSGFWSDRIYVFPGDQVKEIKPRKTLPDEPRLKR